MYTFVDSLTHIALGACMGDAFAGKQLGKRAMFLGAVAQSVPDIDFIPSFWLSTAENLLALAFVGAGIITMQNALAVIMGANLRTTITGWNPWHSPGLI